MKALIREAGGVRLVDVPAPELRGDDVIVEVICAGICRTDLAVARGTIASADPITLGHELCGRVIAGPGVGDLVTADPRISDGFLGIDLHGAFAERVRLPAASVWKLPAGIDPRVGAYVEPLAAALAVPAIYQPGHWVIAGSSRFSKLVGVALEADPIPTRSFEIDALRPNAFDVGVETSGTADEIAALVDAIRPGGMLIVRSRNGRLPPLEIDKRIRTCVVDYGSFELAVELIGSLAIDELLGDSYPLARFEDAFAAATASEARKVFLTCAA